MKARENPFRSERLLRLRYRLAPDQWAELHHDLAALNYRAALVGPDGSGKTTLLEDLEPRLQALGYLTAFLRLDDLTPRLSPAFLREFFPSLTARHVILFDGADRLSRWQWWRFQQRSRPAAGLIVTAHQPGLLPTLRDHSTSATLLHELVSELVPADAAGLQSRLPGIYNETNGNIREALRRLYDLYAGIDEPRP